LHDPQIKIIFHQKNLGKGAALRTGFKHASGEIVIIQDADLEYLPEEYPELIKPILDGRADVVYGSRFIGTHRVFLFNHYLGNKILNIITNILYNTNLSDMMTGYKIFRKDVLKGLMLNANRFGIEAEITAEVFKHSLRVYEVPISYNGRCYEEGKKIKWYDFFVELYWLIRQKFITRNVPLDILLKMGSLRNYNRLIFSQIKPYLGKRVLEVGGGIGNITKYLLCCEHVVVTDISGENLYYLKNLFGIYPNINILKNDITDLNSQELKQHDFDTILCLNVLEHIKDDKKALMNIHSIMNEGARSIILVPALISLQGSLDAELGHYRRYDKDKLINLLEAAGFGVEKVYYFNLCGAIGWFINSRVLKRKTFSRIQLWAFDKLCWFIKFEAKLKLPFGISLIAVCKKRLSK
jgi:SAM-dependent methyltransferase